MQPLDGQMKILGILIALFVVPLVYANQLIIGASPLNPPFSRLSDAEQQLMGFDIDVMTAVCSRIKADCKFVPVPFDDLFMQLEAGKIDLAISAIIITPEREANYLFSIPYMNSNGRFFAPFDSKLNTFDDIQSKKVGVRAGSPYKELATVLYNDNVTVKEYDIVNDLFSALENGDIDVGLMDNECAIYWNANYNNTFKLIGNRLPVGKGYGIMAKRGTDDLILKINQALSDMKADGTLVKIYGDYFDL